MNRRAEIEAACMSWEVYGHKLDHPLAVHAGSEMYRLLRTELDAEPAPVVTDEQAEAWGNPGLPATATSSGEENIHIVFNGPPGPEAGRFVEVETPDGKGLNAGEWRQVGDFWHLVICRTPAPATASWEDEALLAELDGLSLALRDDHSAYSYELIQRGIANLRSTMAEVKWLTENANVDSTEQVRLINERNEARAAVGAERERNRSNAANLCSALADVARLTRDLVELRIEFGKALRQWDANNLHLATELAQARAAVEAARGEADILRRRMGEYQDTMIRLYDDSKETGQPWRLISVSSTLIDELRSARAEKEGKK